MKISLPILVVAFETDFGGVVSNTRYLEYMERGRYALLHAAGLKINDIWARYGVQPVVRHVEIDYTGFARHEDELLLHVTPGAYSGATGTLHFMLTRPLDGAVLMRARQTVAFINTQWKPVRVPPWFRDALPPQNAEMNPLQP